MTLGNFDWGFQPTAIDKNRIETLATCAWIREHETFSSRCRRHAERCALGRSPDSFCEDLG